MTRRAKQKDWACARMIALNLFSTRKDKAHSDDAEIEAIRLFELALVIALRAGRRQRKGGLATEMPEHALKSSDPRHLRPNSSW